MWALPLFFFPMNQPAVTIIFRADGTAVQTAGLETPCDEQVQNLAMAGQFGVPPVAGALRGEVWSTGGRILGSTNFDPSAPAPEPVAAAEPVLPTESVTEPDPVTAEGSGTAPTFQGPEENAQGNEPNASGPAPSPPPVSGGGKKK